MSSKKAHHLIFNRVAPIYGIFFNSQKRSFKMAIKKAKPEFDLTKYRSILDVGSGTGALCSVLADQGHEVTGVEPAERMMTVAKVKTASQGIPFISGNILEGLPFEDGAFDIVMASFVAHGLTPEHRKQMYMEMSRIAKHYVIFHDFNENRSLPISLIEWLEGGDYFRFIKTARHEMRSCKTALSTCFSEVKVIDVAKQAAWYICKPQV
ncbi:MAG TPA: class I SAM-dependent methyltransferase [Clostridiales bacterium UBA8960]|nr:class I SAM-dependent methyltransferase [Clostridiales bacterium UBA8960]